MKITWSTQARRDLRAIHNFIARDSEHYANLQIENLIGRVERISEMPSMGHPVHEFKDSGLREVHEGTYRIIYDPQPAELRIVTILHMKQNMIRRRIQ